MFPFRSVAIATVGSVLAVATPLAIAQESRLDVEIVDAAGEPMPARAWVISGEARFFHPLQPASATPYQQDQSFSCDGRFSMLLPPGEATIHVERGKEFVPVDLVVPVTAGESSQYTIRLDRWIDMPSLGWYSADMHLHLGFDNPRVLKQLALADDVHLVPSFTYWLRGRGETWQRHGPTTRSRRPCHLIRLIS